MAVGSVQPEIGAGGGGVIGGVDVDVDVDVACGELVEAGATHESSSTVADES